MKCINIIIETENDAFQPEPRDELARILRELAHNISNNRMLEQPIRDINGNKVGRLKIIACKHESVEE